MMGNSRQWTRAYNERLSELKASLKANGITTASKRKAAREYAAIRPNSQPVRERVRP